MQKFKRSGYFLKITGSGLLIVFFSALQTGFLPALPWPFNYLNLILLVGVFMTFALGYGQALIFAVPASLMLDFFSYLPFGTMALLAFTTIFLVNVMLNNFFTNRSFYSLIFLGFLGNAIYIFCLFLLNLIFFILDFTNSFDKFFTKTNLLGMLWQVVFTVVLLACLFFIFNFLSKKLKSAFY